jgi:osmotically-inducible protein OsmY
MRDRRTRVRTDADIQADVLAELAADVGTASSDIGVSVREGVVRLGGEVESLARRTAAARAAARIHGVRAVADDIFVRLPSEHRLTDTDLAHAIVNALIWDTEVPDKTIKARVQNHWVWLVGEAESHYQRLAAQRAVENILGVAGVTNLVRIKSRPPSANLKGDIERALARNAMLAPREIDVAMDGGRAILTGTVGTFRERLHAEEVARTPLGVTDVDNQIELDP